MTRYALIYGAIAAAVAATVLTIGIASDFSNHTTSLWFGYLVMLVALSLIFVGVKRYRDVQCGGVVRFGRATQHTHMYLVAARQPLGEPQQRWYHSMAAAAIKAAWHDEDDLHILLPKQTSTVETT